MARGTEHDQVRFAIRSRPASPNLMVDFKLIAPATALAFPIVSLENFLLERAVLSISSRSRRRVAARQGYYYVVTAVSSSGMESGYSNEVAAVIPRP